MKTFIIHLTLFVITYSQIFFTEIERNPPGSETEAPGGKSHEYIELVNLTSDTFSIDSFVLTDGVVRNKLVPRLSNLFLPGEVLLINDPDISAFSEPSYASNVNLSFVSQSSICGGLSGSDGFHLLYNDSICATFSDSVSDEGKLYYASVQVDEKDSLVLSAQSLLFDSRYWLGAGSTPGVVEGLEDSFFRESFIMNKKLYIGIRSLGGQGACRLIIDNQEVHEIEFGSDTAIVDSFELDENINNLEVVFDVSGNIYHDTVNLSHLRIPEAAIQITEVSPRSTIEWFELTNYSSETIDLTNWCFVRDEDTITITTRLELSPSDIVVISEKSIEIPGELYVPDDWFSLNNYRDSIWLNSPLGTVDSLMWKSDNYLNWDQESLHRIPQSDGFSPIALIPALSSPGIEMVLADNNVEIKLECTPRLFSPNGDGKDDVLTVSVTKPAHYETTVSIYSAQGELTKSETFSGNSWEWQGDTNQGVTARRGAYVVIAEFKSVISSAVTKREGVVLWR